MISHISKVLFVLSCFLMTACKKTTSYQVIFYNGSNEQLKVKVYSPLALKEDSFIVSSLSQHEVFFKEEEGIHSDYDCTLTMDSVFVYSATHKMRIKVNKSSLWENQANSNGSKEEHRCILPIGKGDTIK